MGAHIARMNHQPVAARTNPIPPFSRPITPPTTTPTTAAPMATVSPMASAFETRKKPIPPTMAPVKVPGIPSRIRLCQM